MTTISKRIKDARARAEISQETLARRANMSLTGLAQLEQGSRTDPHISTLSKIAEALDVPVTELLEEAPVPLGDAPVPSGQPVERYDLDKEFSGSMRGGAGFRGKLIVGIDEVFNDLVKDIGPLLSDDQLARVEAARERARELVGG